MDTGDSSTVRNTWRTCIGCQPHDAAYHPLVTPPPLDPTRSSGLQGPLHIFGAYTEKQAYTHQTKPNCSIHNPVLSACQDFRVLYFEVPSVQIQ